MTDLGENKKLVVGTKQTLKLLHEDQLSEVLIAQDADVYVTKEIEEIAQEKNVKITYVESMKKLGRQCEISVGAATAGFIKQV
jgi:large subunit ribosomal protein L7A